MSKRLLLVFLLISLFSGCASMGQTDERVIQALDEAYKVRNIVYEYAPSRFIAYRKQLEKERKRVLKERWELGLKVNSKEGKISVKHVQKLYELYERKRLLLDMALEKQRLIESVLDKIIAIDRRITAKHKSYMQAGLSPAARAAIRQSILDLAESAADEFGRMKKLEEELKESEKSLSDLKAEMEEGGEGE